MENVLYEYHFNIANFLMYIIPIVIGIGFLRYSIMTIKSNCCEKGWNRFISSFSKVSGFIVGPILLLFAVISIIFTFAEHNNYVKMLNSDNVYTIQGYVENYHPMPYEGHDAESFEINGVFFEYSDYVVMNGYHKSASNGGVIRQNGQHLKIKYVTEVNNNDCENIILYIAEIEDE